MSEKRIGFKDAVKGGFENNGPVVHFVFYFRDHEFKCTVSLISQKVLIRLDVPAALRLGLTVRPG